LFEALSSEVFASGIFEARRWGICGEVASIVSGEGGVSIVM